MNFKQWLRMDETSDNEFAQMGTKKGTYNYVSRDEYESLRPYLVSKSIKRNPKLDPELTAYTPGETLNLLNHKKIQEWFKEMRSFKIPREYSKANNGVVILVSCAATKPWGFSCKRGDFYPYYNEIRRDAKSGKTRPVYFVTISEPLGVVPEDYWGDNMDMIFPQYDNPGLFKDTPLQSGMTTKAWAKSPLGSKREMPFDDDAFEASIQVLGREIADFIKRHKEYDFVSFVEHANTKQKSTHSSMLDVAQGILGYEIPRNPKKPQVGRKKTGGTVADYMRANLNLNPGVTEHNEPRQGMKSRWSVKYKRSIDCGSPSGFSQRNYCKRQSRGGKYKGGK